MVRVLGCPARDEAEVVALVGEIRPPVVCVAASPPGGLAHTRYLIRRLRAIVPESRILVGRWCAEGEPREIQAGALAVGADEVAVTLRESRDQVLRLLPVLGGAPGEPAVRASGA